MFKNAFFTKTPTLAASYFCANALKTLKKDFGINRLKLMFNKPQRKPNDKQL